MDASRGEVVPDAFAIGDVIEIAHVRANGSIGPGGRLQVWRVVDIDGADVRLQPLNDDGTVDTFNDDTGTFWIRNGQLTDSRGDDE